jgi:hypothetical protein
MVSFACPGCSKSLKVKDELAGKKVRCPGCQKAVAVPKSAALPQMAEERTLPPKPAAPADERTLPPKKRGETKSRADAEGQTDLGGGGKGESTQLMAADGISAELTNFLAPAEKADEIGWLGGFRILKVLGRVCARSTGRPSMSNTFGTDFVQPFQG